MDDYVVDMVIVPNHDSQDEVDHIDSSDVNIAVDTMLPSDDVREEVLHVNADGIVTTSNSTSFTSSMVVPEVISMSRRHHQYQGNIKVEGNLQSTDGIHTFTDVITNFKSPGVHYHQQIQENVIEYHHSDELKYQNECAKAEIVESRVTDEQGYENTSSFIVPEALNSTFKYEKSNSNSSNSMFTCALCRNNVHSGNILDGKTMQGGHSERELSQILEESVNFPLKIMCESWPICSNCVTLLQQIDALQHQMKQAQDQLMAMLKPQLVHEKNGQSIRDRSDIIQSPTKLVRKKKRKIKIMRPVDPTIPNQHMNYKPQIDDDPTVLKDSLPPSFLNSRLGEGKRMRCPICEKEMTRKYFVAHVRTCHAKTDSIICKKCVKKFPTEGKFALHMVAMHCNSSIEECAYNTDIENKMTRKGKASTARPKVKVTCPVCAVELNKRYIKRHMQEVHSNDKHYKCKVCNESFVKQSHRRIHMSRIHGVHYAQQKEYRCPRCTRIFIGLGRLQRHIEGVHEHRRNYQCNQCEAAFKTNYGLVLHIRKHTDERPFVCLVCNKAFRRSGSIKKHLHKVHKIMSNVRLNDPLLSGELPVKKVSPPMITETVQETITE